VVSLERFEVVFAVVHTLPKSDFCIYPHSGIPQELKGLTLVRNPLREPWFRILPSGGAPIPPRQGHVNPAAINQYSSLWKNFNTLACPAMQPQKCRCSRTPPFMAGRPCGQGGSGRERARGQRRSLVSPSIEL
jgi:hypothetical protein